MSELQIKHFTAIMQMLKLFEGFFWSSLISNPCVFLQVLGLPTTILTDHTRPVDPSKGEVMMERVREAGGIVTNLGDYLDELDEWSKAKEIARFLIQNSSVSIFNSSSSVISIALSFMLYSLFSQ